MRPHDERSYFPAVAKQQPETVPGIYLRMSTRPDATRPCMLSPPKLKSSGSTDPSRAGSPYSVDMTDARATPLRDLVEARREEIKAIVARHHGRSVAIFGSVARGEERPDSDIDFLVELASDTRPIEILSIGVELEEALGVKVDVGTPASLRERLQDEVLAEAVPL